MRAVEVMLQQLGSAVTSFFSSEEPPLPKQYDAYDLLGPERYGEIFAMRAQADQIYDNQELHEPYILYSGQLYLKAANRALEITRGVDGVVERNFLLENQVLPLYSNASTSFYKFITIPGRYQRWTDILTLETFQWYLAIESRYAALHLLVGRDDKFDMDILCVKDVNVILKDKYSAEQAGDLFVEAAKNAARLNVPDILVLELYNIAIADLADGFFSNNPSVKVVELYKEAMEATIETAARLASTELGIQAFAQKQQDLKKMQDRLQLADIILNEIEANHGIQYLNLGGHGITDAVIEQIVTAINNNPNIIGLNLNKTSRAMPFAIACKSFNTSGMENVFIVEGLKKLASLQYIQYLDLSGNKIDEEGVIALAAMPNLRKLWAVECDIPAVAAKHFLSFPRLEFLDDGQLRIIHKADYTPPLTVADEYISKPNINDHPPTVIFSAIKPHDGLKDESGFTLDQDENAVRIKYYMLAAGNKKLDFM